AEAAFAARLRVRTAPGAPPLPVLDEAADAVADDALSSACDLASLASVARLLAGNLVIDGDWPDLPAVRDEARAAAAARTILDRLLDDGATPVRGTLVAAAGALPADDALLRLTAVAAIAHVRTARHGTTLERHTRARVEAVVLAEAAVILSRAGDTAAARDAARSALAMCGRVPAPARARPLAEVAAVLSTDTDPRLFELGVAAADAEHSGTAGRWDATASGLIAWTMVSALAAAGADPERSSAMSALRDRAELSLRRHGDATALAALADREARVGDPERALRLARETLLTAHVRDPLRRRLARAALAEARDGSAESEPLPPIPQLAQRWLAEGYPTSALRALVAAAPAEGARIVELIEDDLDR
ncbi:MAG: hypothetical protein QM622_03690, partial [Microbacterium sp.]